MAKTGRPLKLHEQIQIPIEKEKGGGFRAITRGERVIELLRAGNFKDDAARIAGLGEATLLDYLARGRADRKAGKKSDFFDFLESVERAQAEANATDLAFIAAAGQKGNWQARAWRLERRDQSKFGQRTRIAIETTVMREQAEALVQKLAQILEERVPDAVIRAAIINDLLDWSAAGDAGALGGGEDQE